MDRQGRIGRAARLTLRDVHVSRETVAIKEERELRRAEIPRPRGLTGRSSRREDRRAAASGATHALADPRPRGMGWWQDISPVGPAQPPGNSPREVDRQATLKGPGAFPRIGTNITQEAARLRA